MNDELNRYDENERQMVAESSQEKRKVEENKYEKRLVYFVICLILIFSTLAIFSGVMVYLK